MPELCDQEDEFTRLREIADHLRETGDPGYSTAFHRYNNAYQRYRLMHEAATNLYNASRISKEVD